MQRHSLKCAAPEILELLTAREKQAGHTKAEMHVEQQEVEKWLQCSDVEIESGHLCYKDMPKALQDILSEWDMENDGTVSFEVLQRAAREHHNQTKQLKYTRLAVCVLVLLLLVSTGMNFVTSITAMEISKEVKASNEGQLMARDGKPASISVSDMEVQGGKLVARGAARGRGGQDNASMAVATRPDEVKKGMSSTIPDAVLDEMLKLTIKSADGVSHMTLRIMGFTRVMAPSKCGSVVHLYSHVGQMTLDDTDLHFDDALAAHAAIIGFSLEEASMHGRRLSSAASISGAFNFFKDYDWQCDSVSKPASPSKPYILKTVNKVPCLDSYHCISSLYEGQMLPGFDEETESVTVAETLAETDDVLLSIRRYPNHPLQTLVEIIDHKERTWRRLQIIEGKAHQCTAMNYSNSGSATDTLSTYYAVYLGIRTRPAVELDLPWRRIVIPQRIVRAFRLQARSDAQLPLPIYYDDDTETLLPTRLFFEGGKAMDLDAEEIYVESLQQEASDAVAELRLSVDLPCSNEEFVGIPEVVSPLTEKKEDVDFYVTEWDQEGDQATNGYWGNALSEADSYGNGTELLADEEQNASHEAGNNSRLLTTNEYTGLGCIVWKLSPTAQIKWCLVGPNLCSLFSATVKTAVLWKVEGEVTMGASGCPFGGAIWLWYGFEKKFKKKILWWKFRIEWSLHMKGGIGARTHKKTWAESKWIGAGRRRRRWSRRRRHYSRRRHTMVSRSGFEVYGEMGVMGNFKVNSFQVIVGGAIRVTIGPWPQPPLDARLTFSAVIRACVRVFRLICLVAEIKWPSFNI